MARFLAFVLMAMVPTAMAAGQAGGKEEVVLKVEGKLTKMDPRDKKTNSGSQVHMVNMKVGYLYTIDMVSNQLDSYLRLEDKDGKQLDEDDDSGGMLNARMLFNCTKDGDYKVICTALGDEGGGAYSLTVKKSLSTVKTTTAHDILIGKPAPNFKGDFAINGAAIQLSELKGRVVLLQFWDARLDSCVTTFGRLAALNKMFKDAGLAILGVTFYNSEIGQSLGFDKDTGRLTKAELADKKSDQAALTQFAAYHKLGHHLMALPREEALPVYDAYAVNGLPLAVLIDRKGVIRSIGIDDEKSAKKLETEIKKILEEK